MVSDQACRQMFNLNCKEARIMPHICHFPGVNSVTNIERDKGYKPAPVVKNVRCPT